MPNYTSLKEIERKKALVQHLRQGPSGGYIGNPFGALAAGLNAYTAGREGRNIGESEEANTALRGREMNALVNQLRGGEKPVPTPLSGGRTFTPPYESNNQDMVNALRGMGKPENQQPMQFTHPDVQDLYTKHQLAKALREPKDRRIIKAVDDVNRYVDTGEPVFTGVEKPEGKRQIIKAADNFNYYADTRERVLPDVQHSPKEYNVSPPTNQDIEEAGRLIRNDDELADIDNFNVFAYAVASRGRKLMKQDNLDSYEAMRQGINTLRKQVTAGEKRTGFLGLDFTAKDLKPHFNPDSTETNSNTEMSEIVEEGKIAVNPQTGERKIFKGGQWVILE